MYSITILTIKSTIWVVLFYIFFVLLVYSEHQICAPGKRASSLPLRSTLVTLRYPVINESNIGFATVGERSVTEDDFDERATIY